MGFNKFAYCNLVIFMTKRFGTRGVATALFVCVCLAAVSAAHANSSTISGSGYWAANAPTTPYSLGGKAFSFSVRLNGDYAFTDLGSVKVIDPSQVRDVRYSLDGVPIATSVAASAPPNCAGSTGTLCAIEVIDSSGGGGLTLDFADWSVNLFGVDNVDIGSRGKLKRGVYSFIPNINGDPSVVDGQINEGDGPTLASIVPEPATWAMMIVGLGVIGASARGRRRRMLSA